MKYTAEELLNILNQSDESPWIEAKSGSESSISVMETVCAFCNEPGLDGGYIILGVSVDESSLFPQYKVIGTGDLDKLQSDIATQCANMFNIPVRPEMFVEQLENKNVLVLYIAESRQKPIFFKKTGLPSGALRRIGSTDQRCTEDDMRIFYQDNVSYDQTPITGLTIKNIDENAIKRYRVLRKQVNPSAEELTYDDVELLQALGCVNRQNPTELNMAGLLIFGTSAAQRSTYPMLRIDYIRVPGNQWVQDFNNRFTTIDMRGSLLLNLFKLIDAVNADLPKGFMLKENEIQATSVGLPLQALREAIVNALMHRSYREHRPIQIIRYDNRIEIVNPGFSLKSEEKLGFPGSETRNPFIAAIFHETNLAETKGSGIRAMRRLMQEANLAPPTFESNRDDNEFTTRLLLHHFLDKKDIEWLKNFEVFGLNDSQKQALIFVREVGAIDNQTYRQMADCDTIKATTDLRTLRKNELLLMKGKGKAAYYLPGIEMSYTATPNAINSIDVQNIELGVNTEPIPISTEPIAISTEPSAISTEPSVVSTEHNAINTEPIAISTEGDENSTEPDYLSEEASRSDREKILNELPEFLRLRLKNLKERERDSARMREMIKEICEIRPFKLYELASLFQKGDNYLSRKYLKPMLDNDDLNFNYPDMINHPDQAYITKKNK